MGNTYSKNLFAVYLKFKLTGHLSYLQFIFFFFQNPVTLQESHNVALGGTSYSCSLLSHAPATECLRSGSQEAGLKVRIHVQVIYLKKYSLGRLIGKGENKAGQDRESTRGDRRRLGGLGGLGGSHSVGAHICPARVSE